MKDDPICRTCLNSTESFQRCPVVRLAKAHTGPALPESKVPVDQICFVSYGDASGGSTRAEQAQGGYVIMFADRALLESMAAP